MGAKQTKNRFVRSSVISRGWRRMAWRFLKKYGLKKSFEAASRKKNAPEEKLAHFFHMRGIDRLFDWIKVKMFFFSALGARDYFKVQGPP